MKIDLNEKIDSLSVFYNVIQDGVIQAMKEAFLTRNDSSFTSKYSLFYHRLAESGYIDDFYGYIYNLVRYDDNIWAREIAKNADVSKTLISQVKKELQILNEIAKIDINSVKDDCPIIKGVEEKKSISYDSLAKEIKKYGFGIFSKYDAFLFDGNLNPILNPPDIKLSSLIGFHSQQEEIISNTKAFLFLHFMEIYIPLSISYSSIIVPSNPKAFMVLVLSSRAYKISLSIAICLQNFNEESNSVTFF